MGIRVKYDPSRGLVSTYGEDEQGVDLPTLGIPNAASSNVDPSVDDDVDVGFQVGSRWWNTSSQEEFVCLSAAQGAAVWLSTTTGGGVSSGSSGAGGADPGAQYLLLSATGSLANERVFTVDTGLLGIDSGAGAAYTVRVNDSIVATLSGSNFSGPVVATGGLSGSLQRTSSGLSYLVGSGGTTVTSASNGQISISTPKSVVGSTVWVADTSVSSSAYPLSSIRYVPLRNDQTDSIEFQFASAIAGSFDTSVLFAMSSAEANVVNLQFDSLIVGENADPNSSPSLGASFNVTPGSNMLMHTASYQESATLRMTASEGDVVWCRLTRSGSADSHTGDMRVIEIRVK